MDHGSTSQLSRREKPQFYRHPGYNDFCLVFLSCSFFPVSGMHLTFFSASLRNSVDRQTGLFGYIEVSSSPSYNIHFLHWFFFLFFVIWALILSFLYFLLFLFPTQSACAAEYAEEWRGYDTKPSDDESPVLELWGMRSSFAIPLVPCPLSLEVVVLIRILLMHYIVSWKCYWSACGVMVIVVGNGHGDTSSNPGRDLLHFT